MKSILTVLLVLSLTLTLAACNRPVDDTAAPVPTTAASTTITASTALATTSQVTPTAADITEEEAKAIAIAHAQIEPIGVTAEYERDNGVPVYEIEFIADGVFYEYNIHAKSGEIVTFKKEEMTTVIKDATNTTATTAPTPTLSADRAKEIAYAHAKVTADKVYDVSVEFERKRGTPLYEVEFNVERTEHHYTIHADTGEILHSHTERD